MSQKRGLPPGVVVPSLPRNRSPEALVRKAERAKSLKRQKAAQAYCLVHSRNGHTLHQVAAKTGLSLSELAQIRELPRVEDVYKIFPAPPPREPRKRRT